MSMRDIQIAREKVDMQQTSVADLQTALDENQSCEVISNLVERATTGVVTYIESVTRKRADFFKVTAGMDPSAIAYIGVRTLLTGVLTQGSLSVVAAATASGTELLIQNDRAEEAYSIEEKHLKARTSAGITLLDIVSKALPELFRVSLERESKVKTVWMVNATKAFEQMTKEHHKLFNVFRIRMMPMVVKPDGWAAMTGGGYLLESSKKSRPLVKRMSHHPMPEGDTIFRGINQMQGTAFRINKKIFALCKELQGIRPEELKKIFHEDKGAFKEECPVDKEADAYIWEKVMGVKVNKKTGKEKEAEVLKYQDDEAKEKRKAFFAWKGRKELHEKKDKARKSIDTSYEACLDLVAELEEFDEIFWPESLDRRSRVYPSAMTGINLQGADYQKGHVEFAEALPIMSGEGVYAIQKSLCNHWGEDSGNGVKTDKLTELAGKAWVAKSSNWITACAADPLKHRAWMKADKPIQFLVAAMEWAGWLQHVAEKGEGDYTYLHRLCDQNDASCSGAQILSAMTRDEVGAMHTNLMNMDVQDLYMACARKVTDNLLETFDDEMSQDWLGRSNVVEAITQVVSGQGHEILTDVSQEIILAEAEKGLDVDEIYLSVYLQLTRVEQDRLSLITRNLVKKPVMVKFYSGTRFGNIEHCRDKIQEWEWEDNFRCEETHYASTFMGGLIYDSINQVISGAGHVMEYFVHIADVFGKYNLPIKWTTPVGFNATMSKKKEKTLLLRVAFRDGELKKFSLDVPKMIKDHNGEEIHELDTGKMKSGIAPDIVHSLDASLILKVAARCADEGIENLWMVHDSLGCHCCYSEKFNRIIREEFINLFRDDVLGNMFKGFREQLETYLRGVHGDMYHEDMLDELLSPEDFGIKTGTWELEEMLESEFCFK